ncbi:MAG: aquaporin [Pseudomonadota bacterium]
MNLSSRLLAEMSGTMLLLSVVVGSGIMGEQLAQGNTAVALLANSLATGCGLYVLISLFAPLSGAHFNPVVTLRAWWRGDLSRASAGGYVLAQIIGGILGVWLAHLMFDLSVLQTSTKLRTGYGQWIAETVATFGLVLTIALAERSRPERIAALVAAYITAAYWFTASTSFANPAVTVARSLTDTFAGISPASVAGFIAAQVVGLTLAMFVADRLLAERKPVGAEVAEECSSRST